MDEPSIPPDAAAFSAEQNVVERSPAQPDGPDRIDADDPATRRDDGAPAHEKHERGRRMTH